MRGLKSLIITGMLTARTLGAQVAAPTPTQSPEAVAVMRQVHAYDAAWARHDTVMIRMLLTPAYQYSSTATGTATRSQTLAFLALPGYRPSTSTRDSVSVQVHDTTATVQSVLRTSGVMNGHTFTEAQRCTLDLVAPKGVWLIGAEQCEKVAAPPPPAGRRGRGKSRPAPSRSLPLRGK